MQLCVFRLGFLQDRDIGVGVFSKFEKISVRNARLVLVSCACVGAAKLHSRQRSNGIAYDNARVIRDFLELDSGFSALMSRQISLATHIRWVVVAGAQGNF